MGIIEDELEELKRCVERQIQDSKLISCVPAMIRVELTKSNYKKIAVCMTFPSNYPSSNILVELKSKTLSEKLLYGLQGLAEKEAKQYIGKPHVLFTLKFINQYMDEHPLCCCVDEITKIKQLMDSDKASEGNANSEPVTKDKLKLSQKTSTISLHVYKNEYFIKTKIKIPEDYPENQISLSDTESNFPRVFKVWFIEKTRDIARQCVEPPLRPKPKDPPFVKRPSLEPAILFLVKHVKRYPEEICQICRKPAFPKDPSKAIHNENAAAHVERVYCSHIYHHDCLILYMKTPPFEGGKKCKGCDKRIYHEKWKVTPELAEARWAHQQAKDRELGDVVECYADLMNS